MDTIGDILRKELWQRKQTNPRYSLRSFSRTLGLSSSYLSKVCAGKRSVSKETLLTIAARLKWSDAQLEKMMDTVFTDGVDSGLEIVKLDQFKYIADWHHYAILECATLRDFKFDAKWIAQRLSISEARAASGLERLVRIGLIQLDKKGQFVGVTNDFVTSVAGGSPTAAHTEHERQILEGAIQALQNTAVRERHQTSVTLAIPQARLAEAVKKIRKFRDDLMTSLQRKGARDAIYQLSISFYPLTNITKGVKNES